MKRLWITSTAVAALLMAGSPFAAETTSAEQSKEQGGVPAAVSEEGQDTEYKEAGEKDHVGQQKVGDTEAAATQAQSTMYLKADQVSARELLGAAIIGSSGERIARVDDIVINKDGEAETVVFLSGGLFGLLGKRGALDYESVDLALDNRHEPTIRVSMTEGAIQSVAAYETEAANDYKLASELIGASAELAASDDKATVTDLIIEKDGQVEFAVVQNGIFGSFGAEKRAVSFSELEIAQGAGGGEVVLDLTPEMIDGAARFEYAEPSEDQ